MGAHQHVVEIRRTAVGKRTGIEFTCVDTLIAPAGSIGLADAVAELGGVDTIEVVGSIPATGVELEAWEARYWPQVVEEIGTDFAIRIAVRPATEADR